MTVADLIAKLQEMDQSLPVVALGKGAELHDAMVRIERVRSRSSYGTYSLPPDAQNAEGWVGELSVVMIS